MRASHRRSRWNPWLYLGISWVGTGQKKPGAKHPGPSPAQPSGLLFKPNLAHHYKSPSGLFSKAQKQRARAQPLGSKPRPRPGLGTASGRAVRTGLPIARTHMGSISFPWFRWRSWQTRVSCVDECKGNQVTTNHLGSVCLSLYYFVPCHSWQQRG